MNRDTLFGIQEITDNGGDPIVRKRLNLRGDAIVGDDPDNGRINVTMGENPSRWHDLLNVDFTAQPSQSLASDNDYTIAGLTWTKTNSAYDQASMVLTAGDGIVCCPKADWNAYHTTYTAPMLSIPLASLLTGSITIGPQTPLRAMLRGHVDSAPYASGNDLGVGLSYRTGAVSLVSGTRHNNNSSCIGGQCFLRHAGGLETVHNNVFTSGSGTYNVPVFTLPNGIGGMAVSYGRGIWDSGWPADADLHHACGWAPDNNYWPTASWPAVADPTNWQLDVYAVTTAMDAAWTWHYENVRLQAFY